MVHVYHGRGCLKLCRACRRSVYKGESSMKFMKLGSVSPVLGEDCLCRQISVSMAVMLTSSTCLCYQVSLNVGQIPHQNLEGWDIFISDPVDHIKERASECLSGYFLLAIGTMKKDKTLWWGSQGAKSNWLYTTGRKFLLDDCACSWLSSCTPGETSEKIIVSRMKAYDFVTVKQRHQQGRWEMGEKSSLHSRRERGKRHYG